MSRFPRLLSLANDNTRFEHEHDFDRFLLVFGSSTAPALGHQSRDRPRPSPPVPLELVERTPQGQEQRAAAGRCPSKPGLDGKRRRKDHDRNRHG